MLDYTKIPVPHMVEPMKLYMEQGIQPGNFLTALLSNDLMGMAGYADEANRTKLFEWARWLYNEAPIGSHGSAHNVIQWMKSQTEENK